jgi:undecaprenyl diphosphate synthase
VRQVAVSHGAARPALDADGVGAVQSLPTHVAVIMDGNGRWAVDRGLSRSEGHRAGTENVRRVLKAFVGHGIKYLTLFTFSTENWARPEDEVSVIMDLLGEVIDRETLRLHEEGIRIKHIGQQHRLPAGLQKAIRKSVELTKDNEVLTLSVAFDYGGREEILNAVRSMVADQVAPEEISEEMLQGYLYTSGLPDPDLIIRTGGEMRLSNFLLWQAAYAEYYATPVLWPDFGEEELAMALTAFSHRKRRYGKVNAEEPT